MVKNKDKNKLEFIESKKEYTDLEILEIEFNSVWVQWLLNWLILGLVNYLIYVQYNFDIFFSKFNDIESVVVWFIVLFLGIGMIYLNYLFDKRRILRGKEVR